MHFVVLRSVIRIATFRLATECENPKKSMVSASVSLIPVLWGHAHIWAWEQILFHYSGYNRPLNYREKKAG